MCVPGQYSGIRPVRRGCLLDSLMVLNALTVITALAVGGFQVLVLSTHKDLSRESPQSMPKVKRRDAILTHTTRRYDPTSESHAVSVVTVSVRLYDICQSLRLCASVSGYLRILEQVQAQLVTFHTENSVNLPQNPDLGTNFTIERHRPNCEFMTCEAKQTVPSVS